MALLLDDRSLLDRFRAGDRDALEKVYRTYVSDVAKLIRLGFAIDHSRGVRGVRDPDEQLDFLHEVFARAFSEKARLSYDGLRPYRVYLLRIAKNYMIDRARRSGREFLVESDEHAFQIDAILDRNASLPQVEADLDWKRQRELTIQYIDSISPEQQEFIDRRFVRRQTQASIAKDLGTSRRQIINMEKEIIANLTAFLRERGVL